MDSDKIEKLNSIISDIREATSKKTSLNEITENTDQLEITIKHLCTTFLSNWEQEHLPDIKSFREAFNGGIPIPVLSVCGKGTQEIRWTKYLSYFLNPKAHHGLGSRLISEAFGDVLRNHLIDVANMDDIIVEDEVYIGSVKDDCRCDIVISSKEWLLFVEQKINSSESKNAATGQTQLRCYSEAIKTNPGFAGKKIMKVFLTLTGKTPKGADDWLPMTHQELIRAGRKILKDHSLTLVARGNLMRFLMDMAIGPYNQTEDVLTEMQELADRLCKKGFELESFVKYSQINQQHSHITELIREGLK